MLSLLNCYLGNVFNWFSINVFIILHVMLNLLKRC
jgi:hypothetical protein